MRRLILHCTIVTLFSCDVCGASEPTRADQFAQPSQIISVKDFGAKGDGKADDSKAIQAALDSLDANRGGKIWLPRGSYRIATGLRTAKQGTEIECEGMPGVSMSQGQGSTRIISDNGVTALTLNPGPSPSHQTIGYRIRNCAFRPALSATSGNGIVGQNVEGVLLEDVTISDYHGGICLLIDGKSGNAQYWTLRNPNLGDCLIGIKTQGVGPNGLEVFGGYFAGRGVRPRSGSIGVDLTAGATDRFFGTRIQGYETGFYDDTSAGDTELYGPRFEFNNINLRVGANSTTFKLQGGSFVNSILVDSGAGNVGIQVDWGATGTVLDPNLIAGSKIPILDNSGGRVKYPTYGSTAQFFGRP